MERLHAQLSQNCRKPLLGLGLRPRLTPRPARSSPLQRTPLQHAPQQRRAPSIAISAASSSYPAPSGLEQQQQQQGGDPLSSIPLWAKLLGAAAAFAAWYSVASAVQSTSPFLSLSLAAAGTTSAEGLRVAVRSAWAGLAAGCLHTLAGADHLAALTPLTIGRSHFKASLMGALWGFGHSTGQLILGLLMVVLKDRFEKLVPALSKWGGTTVGLTLLAIGCLGLYESFFEGDHDHGHGHGSHGDEQEFEMQNGVLVAKSKPKKGGLGSLATFATGIVYGLQPDALFVIVPALALPTKLAAAAYIVTFVLGTAGAMAGYTAVIGATSAAIKKSDSGLTQKLSGVASFVAIAIGSTILAGALGIELPFNLPFGLGGH